MAEQTEQIIVYTDGGSRGNPGPAAAGFILTDAAGTQLQAKAFFLGQATNNVAEYTAIHKALEAAKHIGAKELTVFSDSELLVKQINGQYKVKSERIRPLFRQAVALLDQFQSWKVRYINRGNNTEADRLVNRALDCQQDVEAKIADSGQRIAKKLKTQNSKLKTMERYMLNAKRYKRPIRLGVLISGGGTTLMNILKYIQQGRLKAEVALVISSLSTVAGVEKAKAAGLNVKIIRKLAGAKPSAAQKDYPDLPRRGAGTCRDGAPPRLTAGIDDFSKRIEEELVAANVDLVIQGGWLCLWKIPARYENRVMNIHPALLPSFGGKGMWGHHVHEAVLAAGCKISGCTVHFCTNEYDEGPIIIQRPCEVRDDDTPETLAARVFEQECIAYPQAIELFQQGKLVD